MATFTKGPWHISHSGYSNSPFVIYTGDRAPNFKTRFPLSGVNTIAEVFQDESPAHEEQAANAHLIGAATDMFVALAKLVCPECGHELQHHVDKHGCEIERGDRQVQDVGVVAMGPCGCSDNDLRESFPDYVRAIEALRKAKAVR